MGEINAALAGPVAFQSLGQEFLLSPPRQKHFAELERAVEAHHYRGLNARRAYMDEDEYQEERKALNERVANFEYSFGKPAVTAFLKTVTGLCIFGAILLRPHHPDASADLVLDIVRESGSLFAEKLNSVLSQGPAVQSDPEPTKGDST